MGHSLNPLILRVGLSYKWYNYFIASHYIDYFMNYSFFVRFLVNYCYYLFRFKYQNLCYSIGLFLTNIRLTSCLKKKNFNLHIYLYDLNFFIIKFNLFKLLKFKMKKQVRFSYKNYYKRIAERLRNIFYKQKYIISLKHKNMKFLFRNLRFRFVYNFLKKKFFKQMILNQFIFKIFFRLYKNVFYFSFYKKNYLIYIFNYFKNFYFCYRRFLKIYFFFMCNFYLIKLKKKSFLLEKYYKFFLKKKLVRFFIIFYLKKVKNDFFFKNLQKVQRKKKLKMGLNKFYYYFFRSIMLGFDVNNMNIVKSFVFFNKKKIYNIKKFRGVRLITFILKYYKLFYYYFFFKNFFIKLNKQYFVNYKFLYFIFYIYYRFKFLRKYKKYRKILKKKSKKSRIIFFFFKIFVFFLKRGLLKKYFFNYLVKKFYRYLFRWFLYFIMIKYVKILYFFYYKFLSIFIYYKVKFLIKKIFNSLFYSININLYPVNYGIFFSSFILLLFRWKFERKFTLNQIIWPYIKLLSKFSFVKGFFLKAAGRFTRRQRASLFKYNYGKIKFSTYSLYLIYDFITVKSKYGLGGIKLWMNIKFKIKRQFYKFYLIKLY